LLYLCFKFATDFKAASFSGDEGNTSFVYSDLVLGPSIFENSFEIEVIRLIF